MKKVGAAREGVTRAKRAIACIETSSELQEIKQYIHTREKVLNDRARIARVKAKWNELAVLPVGSIVVVNLKGDAKWPRGTELKLTRVARVWMSFDHNNEVWRIHADRIYELDLTEVTKFDDADFAHPRAFLVK